MSEAVLTLRELFAADANDLSARAEPGLDVYQAAVNARREIEKEARTIRWPWVRRAVSQKSQELLNLNVVDVLIDAWKKYMEIAQYGDTRKYGPGEEILAPLATHTLESEHHPYVQILLKEREVGRVEFDLNFSLTLEGFVLKIVDGKIREILTGSGKGEASLSLADVTLWKQELKPVNFPGHISLGSGIALKDLGGAKTA